MITWLGISFVLKWLIKCSLLEVRKQCDINICLLQVYCREGEFMHSGPSTASSQATQVEEHCSRNAYCLNICITVSLAWHRCQYCCVLPATSLWSLLRAECVPGSFREQKDQWHPATGLKESEVISLWLASSWVLFGSWPDGLYQVVQVMERVDLLLWKLVLHVEVRAEAT